MSASRALCVAALPHWVTSLYLQSQILNDTNFKLWLTTRVAHLRQRLAGVPPLHVGFIYYRGIYPWKSSIELYMYSINGVSHSVATQCLYKTRPKESENYTWRWSQWEWVIAVAVVRSDTCRYAENRDDYHTFEAKAPCSKVRKTTGISAIEIASWCS